MDRSLWSRLGELTFYVVSSCILGVVWHRFDPTMSSLQTTMLIIAMAALSKSIR